MKVKEIFELALKKGMEADPRGAKGIEEYLEDSKKKYDDLKSVDRKFFNKDRLVNPYCDSDIHVDDGKTEVKRVLVGIDIGDGELMLASQLNERGQKIDLVMAHHPIGKSLAALHDVMDMQVAIFGKFGVPVHVAEKIMEERISEVGRSIHPSNHYRVIDMAKLLKVNFMNTHTITDNLVSDYLEKYLAKHNLRKLGDVVEALMEIPEYEEAKKRGAGPCLFTGKLNHKAGKIMVDMTGGTGPSEKIYKELSRAGVSTIVGMHIKDSSRKLAGEHYMNVVIAGHIASDSLGMNLMLDELEKKGVEIVPCGGLIRVNRNKK